MVAARRRLGDWEIDTLTGADNRACVLTPVERRTGYLLLGTLATRSTEFHQYAAMEPATGAGFYFAPPYQAWQRGTGENTNGLVRQYLLKGESLAGLTQTACTAIARQLNRRPRKRLGYRTPEEC